MRYKGVYIAATNQHIGKTTTTLGLVAALKKRQINVGYSKPAGQRYVHWNGLRVDKDAALFAETMGFELVPEIHSPVIIGPGYTKKFLKDPNPENLLLPIEKSAAILEQNYDFVVYEGTGHPGVGSVVNVSNADVAKHLKVPVILVVKGGIGSTIDRITLCKSLFEQAGVPILGVIINKVLPEKLEMVRESLQAYCKKIDLRILGVLPFEKALAYPLMSTVVKAIDGEVLFNEDHLTDVVQDTIAGSLIDLNDLDVHKKYLLVVSIRRLSDALVKLENIYNAKQTEPNLAGVILTGNAEILPENLAFLKSYKIPAVKTHFDTYESIIKLSKLDVKIRPSAPHKIARAVEMFDQYMNMDALCELLGV